MFDRPEWLSAIERAWRRRSVVWLHGVRRAGKTTLARALPRVEYLDCELPSVRRRLADPEAFLRSVRGARIVLDEVHRLPDPTELLKIAADHFPRTRVLATGSSTLQASARFRDTLAGRKAEVWLTPMTAADGRAFGAPDLGRRLRHGGLPPFFLDPDPPERDYQEWVDAYWARDIQELFRLERRAAFHRLLELLFVRSGGIFEATAYAGPCEVSRPTVSNYLAVLEATSVAHVVRPFATGRAGEIVAAPKVYAFDTGFVACFRGWRELRPDDCGVLFEHLVLNEIHAARQARDLRYWRDTRGHEVDFVLAARRGAPVAIECKWRADAFEWDGLAAFRHRHPRGANWLVAADVDRPYTMRRGALAVECIGIAECARRAAAR